MADLPDLPYYKGWEEERVWQLAELFERAMGLPKILDARRIISRYPPTQIVYATPPISHCRDLLDWNSLRPSLVRNTACVHCVLRKILEGPLS